MVDQRSFSNCTSHNFEIAALIKFRSLAISLPQACKVYRETGGNSAVLCIDFQACPTQINQAKATEDLIANSVKKLNLASSIIFKLGNKVIGWTPISYSQ